jgi:uncharacterized protein
VNLRPVKMLWIYVDESDAAGEIPLYEAIVRRLSHLDINGATVNAGIMGFGSHHRIHRRRLLGISDDRPITITVVDAEDRVMAALPEIRAMVTEGLVLLTDAHLVE